MVIMALDHVRDFFYKADISSAGSVATDPTNMATTNPALFFTRFITHFCAPVFVFLTGTSAFLVSTRRSKIDLSTFLITRGLWLVIVETIFITLAWTFDPYYHMFILQVIWALGVSMIILGLLVFLPASVIGLIGALIVFGHNMLDYPSIHEGLKGGQLADLAYFGQFSVHRLFGDRIYLVVYAFLPWTGLMMAGYAFGKLYANGFPALRRKKILIIIGMSLILLFLILRFINVYGDPYHWSGQERGAVYTFLSFLNVTKYPPSLLFICITIGPSLILLALLERPLNKWTSVFNVFGRVPLLYYVLHLFLIHVLVVVVFYATGHEAKDIITPNNPFRFRPPDLGFGLLGVYLIWIFVVAVLYPVCLQYDKYKSSHRKWWLSYV